jgi:hypothetical protein
LLAEDPQRRAVFSAALRQSEELYDAARAAGPASRPLPLFYGLSQAGRAIAAAHNPDETTWVISGHGLKVSVGGGVDDVRTTTVKAIAGKQGNDAISSVTAAMASPPLAGNMTLSALTAALPELSDRYQLRGDATPALEITPEEDHALLAKWWPGARGSVYVRLDDGTDFDSLMSRYTAVDGYEVVAPVTPDANGWTRVSLSWPAPPSPEATPGTRALRDLSDIAERVDGRWYLRPRLGAGHRAPERLLVWWALLLALSSLARYHPAEWVAALDVDSSRLAVDLEETLRIAEYETPRLISTALGTSGEVPRPVWLRHIAEERARLAPQRATVRAAPVSDDYAEPPG